MINNTINEIKNSLEGVNSRTTAAEEQINDLEDKTPEKQLNEVEIGNLPEKEFRIINDSEDDPGPQKKNGGKDREDARNV